jgi:hypothetical protein
LQDKGHVQNLSTTKRIVKPKTSNSWKPGGPYKKRPLPVFISPLGVTEKLDFVGCF